MSEYVILNCEDCHKPVVKMHKELLQRIREALHYAGDNNPHFYHPGCVGGFDTTKLLECIRWTTKYGRPTHYCFGNPGQDCPPTDGCQLSQFKPVYHRMLNRKARK